MSLWCSGFSAGIALVSLGTNPLAVYTNLAASIFNLWIWWFTRSRWPL